MDINTRKVPGSYGEVAQNIAPVSLMMAVFLPVYTIWFGFAWDVIGWLFFGMSLLFSSYLIVKSIQNIKHSKRFEKNVSADGKKIGKAMGILSGVSYGILWLAVIVFIILKQYTFIIPIITLVIGLHFIPQAKIFNRKIDYFVAPLPIATALIAIFLAINYDVHWSFVYAIASIGGALASSIYGLYILQTYKSLAIRNGIKL